MQTLTNATHSVLSDDTGHQVSRNACEKSHFKPTPSSWLDRLLKNAVRAIENKQLH